MKNFVKPISVVMSIIMMLSVLRVAVGAATAVDGSCGENLTWELDDEGTLIISGTGEMYDYDINENPAPWYSEQEKIKKVLICDGVVSIGKEAFIKCENITKVDIADSVILVGDSAFESCVNLSDVSLGNGVTKIGFSAFFNCKALEYIVLPDSITYLDNWVFSYSGVDVIYFEGTEEQWKNIQGTKYLGPGVVICDEFLSDFHIDLKLNMIYVDTKLTVDMFLPSAPAGSTVKDLKGFDVGTDESIGTGMILDFSEGPDMYFVCLCDIDGNGYISAADARLALRAAVGLENIDKVQTAAADADSDGKITSADARLILRASVGLENPKNWKMK